jgi:hypothetical protein
MDEASSASTTLIVPAGAPHGSPQVTRRGTPSQTYRSSGPAREEVDPGICDGLGDEPRERTALDALLPAALLDPSGPAGIARGAGTNADTDEDLERFADRAPGHADLPFRTSRFVGVMEGWAGATDRSLIANHRLVPGLVSLSGRPSAPISSKAPAHAMGRSNRAASGWREANAAKASANSGTAMRTSLDRRTTAGRNSLVA